MGGVVEVKRVNEKHKTAVCKSERCCVVKCGALSQSHAIRLVGGSSLASEIARKRAFLPDHFAEVLLQCAGQR